MEILCYPKTIFKRTDGSEEASSFEESHTFFLKRRRRGKRPLLPNEVKRKISRVEEYFWWVWSDSHFKEKKWTLCFLFKICHGSSHLKANCYSFDINWYYGDDDHYQCTLLAFDRDGKLVRRIIFGMFENIDFPFYAGSLE